MDFVTKNQESILCPHCGHDYKETSFEYVPEDETIFTETEETCGNCGKMFKLQVKITTSFTTIRI